MGKTIFYAGAFDFNAKNAAVQRVFCCAKILKEIGYTVVLIGVQDTQTDSCTKIEGFTVWMQGTGTSFIQKWRKLASIDLVQRISSQCEDAYGVIAYNYNSIGMMKLRAFCKQNDLVFISDTSEWYDYFIGYPSIAQALFHTFDTVLRMNCLQRRVSKMICSSHFLTDFYKKTCPDILTLPTVCDAQDAKWSMEPVYCTNTPRRFCYVGYSGRKGAKDRIDFAVKGIMDLNKEGYPCVLYVVGMTEALFSQDFPKVSFDEHVRFLGYVEHTKAIQIMHESDFALIARMKTRRNLAGFPTKLGEAFCCGTPVVATRCGDMAEYIEDGLTGFIAQNDTYPSFLEPMRKAVCLPDFSLNQMHERCRKENPLDYRLFTEQFSRFLDE